MGISATTVDGTTSASGVAIGGDVVLTAAHALKGASTVLVMSLDTARRAEVAWVDTAADVAALRVPGLLMPQVLLEDAPGGSIVGVPVGPPETSSYRTATVLACAPPGVLLMHGGAPRGVSGSPVVNLDGGLVGLVIAGAADESYLRAVPASTLRRLLSGRGAQ